MCLFSFSTFSSRDEVTHPCVDYPYIQSITRTIYIKQKSFIFPYSMTKNI